MSGETWREEFDRRVAELIEVWRSRYADDGVEQAMARWDETLARRQVAREMGLGDL